MKARRPWAGFAAALFIGAPLACGDMKQDELDCEEAVAHLQDCCPGFDARRIECLHSDGCTPERPAISIPQSQCIRGENCGELVSSGVCGRAQDAHPVEGDASPDGVCP